MDQSNWLSKVEELSELIGENKIKTAQRQLLGAVSQKIRDDFYLATCQEHARLTKDNHHLDTYLFENFFLSSFTPEVHEEYAKNKKKPLAKVVKSWVD